MYTLIHCSCDGAGTSGTFQTLQGARQEADRMQQASDARGNPWYYTYSVWLRDRCLYRTSSNPVRLEVQHVTD